METKKIKQRTMGIREDAFCAVAQIVYEKKMKGERATANDVASNLILAAIKRGAK